MIKSFISSRNFRKGQSCFSQKDFKNAAEYFRKAAEDGHTDAQCNLGVLYAKGLGVPKDMKDALRWLLKAAEQGHAGAKKNLSLLQEGNQGAKKGPGNNLDLLREIIEKSDENTKIKMRFISVKMGIPWDQGEESAFIRELAEKGDLDMQSSLAEDYQFGNNVPQNYEEALKWYKRLALQEDSSAQCKVGEFFFMGYGVEKNLAEAEKWWQKASNNGDDKARQYLKILSGQETQREIPERDDGFDKMKILYRGLGGERIGTLSWFREQAEKGIADCQYKLGVMYDEGRYISEDSIEAVKWYRKAAEQGHKEAQNKLGHAYAHGEGVELEDLSKTRIDSEDREEISVETKEVINFDFIRSEAEKGNSEMQLKLGNMCYEGEGVPQDYSEAFKWYLEAAKQGNATAQKDVGFMYCNGEGISQDYSEALKWFRKAAEQGNAKAQVNLGFLYCKGKGVPQDYSEALKWYLEAAEQGNADAQKGVGFMYSQGEGVPKDYSEASKWFRKAAEQGHMGAQYLLGVLYEAGKGVEKDHQEAINWYQKAAEQGDAGAQYSLGMAYFIGKGVTSNFSKAVEWFDKAVEQGEENAISRTEEIRKEIIKNAEVGNVAAQTTLAKLYLQGSFGLPQDIDEAVRWMELAAEQGDEDSQHNLAQLSKLLGNAKKKGFDIQFEEQVPKAESISQEIPPDDVLAGLYLDALKEKNTGNIDKAIVVWKKILEKDFRQLDAINNIACAYAETGKLDMAKKYIDMAMKVGGDQADFVRINLAGILHDTGKYEEAEEILNAIECKGGRTIDNLTRVLVAQGKSERALELIEEFLAKEGASTTPGNDEDHSLQEIVTRGIDCILECKPDGAIDFLETYAHILPSEPLAAVYFNAGIHFLQEENDGVRALKCLSEAVKNKPEDSEAKEASSDAALKVIADLGGKGKISETEKAALATAYETVGNKQKALEIKKQIPSIEIGEGKKPSLRLVANEIKPTVKSPDLGGKKASDVRTLNKEEFMVAFWQSLLDSAKSMTNLHLNAKPGEKPYVIARVKKYLQFNYVVAEKEPFARVELYISSGEKAKNKAIYDSLHKQKAQIEQEFGGELKWDRLDDKDACRISNKKPLIVWSYKDQDRWPEIQRSMIDAMVRFEKAIMPYVMELDI